jgi:hypothetical protein
MARAIMVSTICRINLSHFVSPPRIIIAASLEQVTCSQRRFTGLFALKRRDRHLNKAAKR